MEKVILNTSQLNQLAFHHPTLAPYFMGTFPCDQLPNLRRYDGESRGLIVNTDPSYMEGRHWLGIWFEKNKCEVFDSLALKLDLYETTDPLKDWLKHFKYVVHNDMSCQSIYDQSCGGYALMFLVARSQDLSLTDFQKGFYKHNYVLNDQKVAWYIRQLIYNERKWMQESTLRDETDETLIQGTSRSINGVRHLLVND